MPNSPSIILTTSEEVRFLKNLNKNKVVLLHYSKKDNFDRYMFDIIREYRIGVKSYSNLLFSIDPGKKLGLMVFLEDLYLYSETHYNVEDLFKKIKQSIKYLDENKQIPLKIDFKFGRGVMNMNLELISKIFSIIQNNNQIRVFLINEAYSSKMKLHKLMDNMSKHEASALILALRKGIEVKKHNFLRVINQIKSNKIRKEKLLKKRQDLGLFVENKELIKELFVKIITGEISLSDCIDYFNNQNNFA
jgi:hypothetical protein